MCKGALERLDDLYHSVIRFATNAPYRTHHCTLYSSINWSSLCTRRKTHWLILIYKTLLGLTPPYLRYLLQPSSSTYNTRSPSHILLKVPKAHTSLGRLSFQFVAASDWNELQQTLGAQFYLNLFIWSLHHRPSYWHLWLLCVMYCCLYLLDLCAVVCPIMFVPCSVLLPICVATMLLSCCVDTMLCCRVLLPCYVVVLGLSLCGVVLSLSWCVFCPIFIYFVFLIPAPIPIGGLLVGCHCK